jgi:Tfp pilus assembly PilM family ATPase
MGWGLEIDPERLRLCRAEMRGGRISLRRQAEVGLPSGLIRPSLKDPNVKDAAALTALLRDLRKTGGCRDWVRLALPDAVFTLRTVVTDEPKGDRDETRRFLRWQLRHLLPFPAEEARLDFLPTSPGPDGRVRAICLLGRDPILTEYEEALRNAGLRAAALDARSICLAQAASGQLEHGTAGLLAVGPTRTTLLVLQEGCPRFWRVLPEGRRGWVNGDRARLMREVAVSITYCQDSEGVRPLDRIAVGGLGELTAGVAEGLTEWLGTPVTALDLGAIRGLREDPAIRAEAVIHWGAALGAAIRPC